jgi:hypothetical protein
MNYITFEKDRYHEHLIMEDWCQQHFGKGAWINEPYPQDWTGMPAWTVHCMFGRATFAFRDVIHYNWFVLRWS